jgi:cobalt-zinc-cadmium efflux system membrane fusion protein
MTKRWALIPLLIVASACGRCGSGSETPNPATTAQPSTAAAGEHDDENELEVDPGMLRDLRMTTMAVEQRTAAESSQALIGELQVNERQYGEVTTPVDGRVSRVFADVGQAVRAGRPLVEIQSAELGRTRAAYFSAQARLELARRALERKRTLAAERIAPLREVQEAEADARAAEADLRAARAGLEAIGVSAGSAADSGSSRLTLRAPVNGVVIERDVVVGQPAASDRPLFRIGNLSQLWLVVHAFERDAVRIRGGAAAAISFAALPGQVFPGKVALVGNQVDVSSRTIPVRIEVQNRNNQLRPGMSASATLPLGEATATILVVPLAALQRFADKWVVFIPKDEGHFEIRTVGRGREFGQEIEVVSGLKAGDKVVVEGAFVLKAEAEKARGQGDAHGH